MKDSVHGAHLLRGHDACSLYCSSRQTRSAGPSNGAGELITNISPELDPITTRVRLVRLRGTSPRHNLTKCEFETFGEVVLNSLDPNVEVFVQNPTHVNLPGLTRMGPL